MACCAFVLWVIALIRAGVRKLRGVNDMDTPVPPAAFRPAPALMEVNS